MPEKYMNKYRIQSARLQNWDYGSNGAYFITICTANRLNYFGDVVQISESGGIMQLTETGKLAQKFWMEIPDHFNFVKLGNFVIMPNHVHGILIIDKPDTTKSFEPMVETLQCNVSTIGSTPDTQKNEQMAKISPKPGSISTIIRSYKSVVSKFAGPIDPDFAWQSRFHDHIIRDSMEYERIQNYITNNPKNWNEDKFYE